MCGTVAEVVTETRPDVRTHVDAHLRGVRRGARVVCVEEHEAIPEDAEVAGVAGASIMTGLVAMTGRAHGGVQDCDVVHCLLRFHKTFRQLGLRHPNKFGEEKVGLQTAASTGQDPFLTGKMGQVRRAEHEH